MSNYTFKYCYANGEDLNTCASNSSTAWKWKFVRKTRDQYSNFSRINESVVFTAHGNNIYYPKRHRFTI